MSRWSDAFAVLSAGHDTVDTLRQSGETDAKTRSDGPLGLAEAPVVWRVEPTPPGDLQAGSTTPESAILLRDGRRLHRLAAAEIPDVVEVRVKALLQEARGCGAEIWGDGIALVVVEPWGRMLPALLFDEVRQHAGAIFAELCTESHARGNWLVFDPPGER